MRSTATPTSSAITAGANWRWRCRIISSRSARRNPRLVPGLVGAFLGSLIGCALWVVIYRLGYIAGIAGAVTAICAMKGYEMLGGHLDRKGVAGSAIIMVVMIYFANRLGLGLGRLLGAGRYGWGFFECFQYLGSILESSDLTGNYMGDLIIGYVLTQCAASVRLYRPSAPAAESTRLSKTG